MHNGERKENAQNEGNLWYSLQVCSCVSHLIAYICTAGYSQAFVPGKLCKSEQTNQLVWGFSSFLVYPL